MCFHLRLKVDDDAVLRKLFMRAVKKAVPSSWTIMEASSGEMALRICEEKDFDLIFLGKHISRISWIIDYKDVA